MRKAVPISLQIGGCTADDDDSLFRHDAFDEELRIEKERQRFKVEERAAFEKVAIGKQRSQPINFPVMIKKS